jgi:hypothetical protein
MMADLFYLAAVALMFTHELDAMKRREWRILPIFRSMTEEVAETVFIWLHAPLFAAIIALSWLPAWPTFKMAFAAFCILHVGLHWLLRNHPANEFDNPSSQALIWLSAAFGTLHLVSAG